MKKIIWLLLCLPILTVKASTYYTDYDVFELGSSINLEESEILKKEEIKYYNTYAYELKYVNDYDNNTCDGLEVCTKVVKTNYKIDDKVTSTNAIKGKEGNIKSFKITNNYEYQTLNYMQVRSGYNLIDFKVIEGTNGIDFYEKLKDNLANFAMNTQDYFIIELDKSISISDFRLYITQNSDYVPITLDIELYYDDGTSIRGSIVRKNVKVVNKETFDKISSSVGTFNNTTTSGYATEKYTVYEGYQNERVVLNDYQREGNNLILDDYIIKYDYYKRDYLKVLDEINENTNIKDSIIDTSFNKDKINIIVDKDPFNNIYHVKYKIDDVIFTHDIKIIKNEIIDNEQPHDKNEFISGNNKNENIVNKEPIIENTPIINEEENIISSKEEPIINKTPNKITDNINKDTYKKPITSNNNNNNIPEILDVTYEENTNPCTCPTTKKIIKSNDNILEVEPVNNSLISNHKFIILFLILIIICLILLVKKMEK